MSRCCVGTSDAWLRFVWAVGKCHPHQWESCSSSCNYFPVEFWEFSAGFGCVIIAHTRHTAMGIQISLFLNLKSMFSARRVIKQNTPLPHSYIYMTANMYFDQFFFSSSFLLLLRHRSVCRLSHASSNVVWPVSVDLWVISSALSVVHCNGCCNEMGQPLVRFYFFPCFIFNLSIQKWICFRSTEDHRHCGICRRVRFSHFLACTFGSCF